ncbi:MAG: PAS domain-containing sensor histidine kinase [Ferruginibacter sp.]
MAKTYEQLEKELTENRMKLEEATETIEAIRSGQIDALIVKNDNGHQLYTLKSADQTYRVFIEKMNEGAVTINREGIILYSNSRFADMIALPLSKVIGLRFMDIASKEDSAKLELLLNKGWEHDNKGEISFANKNGNNIPCLISLTTLELDEGTALSIIIADLSAQKEIQNLLKQKNDELLAARNITEGLNNELENKVNQRTNELLQSRENFKFLADNIPVIVWTATPDGGINYFNKKWYQYSGLSQAQSEGWGWESIVHPDDLEPTLISWNNSLKKGERFGIEYRLRNTSDGLYRWHFGHALPFKNKAGATIAWFGICTDIDHQKKTIEEKDEFISMASHELKTPVTTLKGFTQLLLMNFKKENNQPVVGILTTMDNQITKLTRLITDLLDATKLNAGQMQYDNVTFDFNELLQETIYEMQLATQHHEIESKLSAVALVKGDRNRIGQVVSNLISNAIKYSGKSKKILVSTIKENGRVICCVQDFGIGIPKEKQEKLFTRFFRVSDDSTNTFPGMGLGLYISIGIIKKHHGNIWVNSEVDHGSTFCFSLPLAEKSTASAK